MTCNVLMGTLNPTHSLASAFVLAVFFTTNESYIIFDEMYLKWTNTTQTEDRGKKDRDVKEIFFIIENLDQMAVTWCEERDFTGLIASLELA